MGAANSDAPKKPTLSEKWARGGGTCTIRRDAVAVSSILFTLALLRPLQCGGPLRLTVRWSDRLRRLRVLLPWRFITVGLIAAWMYIRGVRWMWFVRL